MISPIKKWMIGIGFLLVLVPVLSLVYCWHLSGHIEKHFSGRKWEIPSTVYSDTTLLFPGKKINPLALKEKLKDLGYLEKQDRPEKKGEFRLLDVGMEIYFRDVNLPDHAFKGVLARVFFKKNRIREIRAVDADTPLASAELGPEILMRFLGEKRELRRPVAFQSIPSHLIHAVVAAEDPRFYRHFGIDPLLVLRAFYTNIRSGAIREGGSTITQQLAKNYFLTPERTFERKIREIFIALAIELKYSKDQILEFYLNEIYFGQQGSVSVNGVEQAAVFYFGKGIETLTLSESALLAGIIKAPNFFSPYLNPQNCEERRNQVLDAMHREGYISEKEYQDSLKEPIKTIGFSKYNRRAPYFLDYVTQQLQEFYPERALSSQGLSIYTTLDTEVQKAAEKALAYGLDRLEKKIPSLQRAQPEKRLQGAVLVMQPRTGNILAMVGGRDYGVSQFNRISQARRQPGSCFKPLIVAALLDVVKPSDLLSNEKSSYWINGKPWSPDNFEEIPEKNISVRDMLRLSCNRAAVDLAVRGGLDVVTDRINAFDFSTPFFPYPSLALGAFEVVPLELARAYSVFAANGTMPALRSIKAISDENGNIQVRVSADMQRIVSPARAYLVTSMLESVVKDGTARSLKKMGVDFPLAGKTGTTSSYRDAWFIGYTPDFLVLIWVGFDNGDPVKVTGSEAALPIFAELVKSMPGYISRSAFAVPSGVVKKTVCKESGELAVFMKCPHTYEEYFLKENQPKEKCHIHGPGSPLQKFFNGLKNIFK